MEQIAHRADVRDDYLITGQAGIYDAALSRGLAGLDDRPVGDRSGISLRRDSGIRHGAHAVLPRAPRLFHMSRRSRGRSQRETTDVEFRPWSIARPAARAGHREGRRPARNPSSPDGRGARDLRSHRGLVARAHDRDRRRCPARGRVRRHSCGGDYKPQGKRDKGQGIAPGAQEKKRTER